jgi:uncharacterized protein (DUF58 family)
MAPPDPALAAQWPPFAWLAAPWRRSRHFLDRWLFRLHGPEDGTITLIQRRIFILPTRNAIVFAFMLAVMLSGAINYALSLGFVLVFLLAGLGVVAILHTFRNLAGLRISAGKPGAVFAGETAHFPFWIENPGHLDRFAVSLVRTPGDAVHADIPAHDSVCVIVPVPATRRGLLRPGRVTCFTRFPLGLFRAWSYLEPASSCVVYPAPERPGIPLPIPHAETGEGIDVGEGHEDFAGLRAYQPSDSPRHVAWKAVARGQSMLTKQFSGRARAELWLDWDDLPADRDGEARLSRLARWVLEARTANLTFGLRLPGTVLAPGTGDRQRDRCLEALALFDVADTDDGHRP